MKWILAATLLAGCTDNANIGISDQPITCQPNAAGAANGTLDNPYTQKSYTFGTAQASLMTSPTTGGALGVHLTDTMLALDAQFSCGQTALGTYQVGAGQIACPLLVNSNVSGNLQQVYGTGHSGIVILDQNVGCLAGRYDIHYTSTRDNQMTIDDVGEVAGWFSVPLQ
jgi:hypothetical protein